MKNHKDCDMVDILKKFRQQGWTVKHTPLLDQNIDSDFHQDGLGFCWYINHKWHLQKSTDMSFYVNVHQTWEFLVGHMRHKGSCAGDIKYENTHFFCYKSFIFCHNGKIINFVQVEHLIRLWIDPNYYPEIQGETDSETIFFFL